MTKDLWFLDTLVRLQVSHGDDADGISLIDSRARRGDSPPLHVQGEGEVFCVLEGEMTVRIADVDHHVGAGETCLVGGGVAHTYRVDSEESRCLAITTHGQFEGLVRALGRPATGAELPTPSGPPGPQQMETLVATAREHGIEIVGPPMT